VNAACALLLLFVMAEAVAEAVGLQDAGQGVHTGALGAHFDFTLKTTINSKFITSNSVRRGLQELIKNFVFWPNN